MKTMRLAALALLLAVLAGCQPLSVQIDAPRATPNAQPGDAVIDLNQLRRTTVVEGALLPTRAQMEARYAPVVVRGKPLMEIDEMALALAGGDAQALSVWRVDEYSYNSAASMDLSIEENLKEGIVSTPLEAEDTLKVVTKSYSNSIAWMNFSTIGESVQVMLSNVEQSSDIEMALQIYQESPQDTPYALSLTYDQSHAIAQGMLADLLPGEYLQDECLDKIFQRLRWTGSGWRGDAEVMEMARYKPKHTFFYAHRFSNGLPLENDDWGMHFEGVEASLCVYGLYQLRVGWNELHASGEEVTPLPLTDALAKVEGEAHPGETLRLVGAELVYLNSSKDKVLTEYRLHWKIRTNSYCDYIDAVTGDWVSYPVLDAYGG